MSRLTRIGEIRQRLAQVPAGAWEDVITNEGTLLVQVEGKELLFFGDMETTTGEDHALASFIAHARSDIEYLLGALASPGIRPNDFGGQGPYLRRPRPGDPENQKIIDRSRP